MCLIMDKKISLILLLFLFIGIGNVSASEDIINNSTCHVDCLSGKCSHMADNFHSLDSKNISVTKTNVNNTQQGDLNTNNSKVDISLNNTQTKSLTALEKLISRSTSNTLELNNDYKYDGKVDSNFKCIVLNNMNYTIDGKNHTIDGCFCVSLFNIDKGNITFLNTNFINFNGTSGVAINANKCVLNISHCKFISNNCVLNISERNIDNFFGWISPNYAEKSCGGAVYLNSVVASISSSIFCNNNAKWGGAIYARNSHLASFDNRFMSNNAKYDGGAIYYVNSTISSSVIEFNNNNARRGGAIYIDEASSGSLFMMNTFKNNTGTFGGAIYSLANNAKVSCSYFLNNTAKSNQGNSIYIMSGSLISHGNLFNNDTSFVAPISQVYGNCTFLNIKVQNNTVNNTTKTVTQVVKGMRLDDNSYMVEKYDAYWNPIENVGCVFSLTNQSTKNIYSILSLISDFVSMEDNILTNIQKYNCTCILSMFEDIHDDNDLKNAIKFVQNPYYNNQKFNCAFLNFESNHTFNMGTRDDGSLFNVNVGMLYLIGNNAKINVKNPDLDNEFHFMFNEKNIVLIDALTVSGFNTAIENHCLLFISNSTFTNNKLDYSFKQDRGGAIKNYGYVSAQNCSFIDNYAKFGGAIYNEGGIVDLVNCSFSNNHAYGKGNDVCNANNGKTNLTNTTCDVANKEGLSNFERFALRIGATVAIIVCSVAVACIPGVGVVLAVVAGAGIGAVFGATEAVIEGYYDNNINWKQVLISAALGAAAGALSGFIAFKICTILRAAAAAAEAGAEGTSVAVATESSFSSTSSLAASRELFEVNYLAMNGMLYPEFFDLPGGWVLINWV